MFGCLSNGYNRKSNKKQFALFLQGGLMVGHPGVSSDAQRQPRRRTGVGPRVASFLQLNLVKLVSKVFLIYFGPKRVVFADRKRPQIVSKTELYNSSLKIESKFSSYILTKK